MFRVTLGAEHVQFNDRVLQDIMYLDGDPVLHIVGEGTMFSAARFLPSISTGAIWETFMKCWDLVYTGLTNKVLTDKGSQLGDLFIHFGEPTNVEAIQTGVEAHSSFGLG